MLESLLTIADLIDNNVPARGVQFSIKIEKVSTKSSLLLPGMNTRQHCIKISRLLLLLLL